MKKFKIIICVILALVVLYKLAVQVISYNDTLAVKSLVSIYENNKTEDNLTNLCYVLSYKSKYEEKIKYFDEYITSGYATAYATKNYSNSEFHQNYYINGYKFEYCLALLHLDKTDEFKEHYTKNVTNIQEQNLFYNILFYELKNFEWTDTQLMCIKEIIENDTTKGFFNEDLVFENDCIKAEIYRLSGNYDLKKKVDQRIVNYISDANQESVRNH